MRKLCPILPLLVAVACSPTHQGPNRSALASSLQPEHVSAEKEALLARLERQKQLHFVAIPGEREFSGEMIARPLQRQALQTLGLEPIEINARRALARAKVGAYRVTEHVRQTDEYVFAVREGSEQEVAKELLATDAFEYVEPNWTVYPIACPNDTFFNQQSHHQANRMNSCAGWDIHTGNPSVGVAFCDTGVRTTHEDLQLHRLNGYNAVDRVWENNGGNIGPVHPHGTQVTGCGAANGNNGKGVAGVGWNLSHRMMRVSNLSSGSASIANLTHAAMTAVDAGDRVSSVSYSGVTSSSVRTAGTYIKSQGGLLVWAAGNNGANLNWGDRDADDVIVAGGTDTNDNLASFSAFGRSVDLVALGVSVATTSSGSDSNYVFATGTSFACPLVAGMCGLIFSANPSLTPNQVEAILKASTDDLGAAGVDDTFGHGRINTLKAMQNAGGSPPIAQFSGTPTSGTAPLNVSFTDLSSNSPTSWSWSFGDGGSSNAQNPSHTYNNPGTYTVTLTATNSFGSDGETKTGYITVNPGGSAPVAEFSGTPTSGTAPLNVSFTDLSSNSPTSWSWSFGDGGSSNAQNPSHTYNNPGTYTVTLTATNAFGSDGETKTGYITVNPAGSAPVAEFSGTPTSGTAPLNVNFTDLSSNSPTSWSWSFGDGGSSNAQNPSHTYTSAGTYTVTLTATNAFGSDGETKTGYITVNPGGQEQQIAFDGWESRNFSGGTGWAGAWFETGDVRITRNRGPHTGSRHVRLRRNTGLIRRQVDLSGVTNAKFIFWAKVRSFEGSDSARVRVSTNGGGSWTTLNTWVNGDDDDQYHRYEYAIGSSSTVLIEFDANMSGRGDHLYVDDIEIRGTR